MNCDTPVAVEPTQKGPSVFFPTAAATDVVTSAWHAKAQLPGRREGLLVDVGAHDNLVGEEWVRRVQALRAEMGLSDVTFERLTTPLRVEGVGKDAQTCYEKAIVPIALASGETGTFSAPMVPNSSIPALYGQKSLRSNRALIDTTASQLHLLGPGDFRLATPPGSRVYELADSPSGHMILPVTEFAAVAQASRAAASSSSSSSH